MEPRHFEIITKEIGLVGLADRVAGPLTIGDCIAVRGELGAGKTTFARALVRALTGDPTHEVPSPTFALRQDYDTPHGLVVHFDLYRIADPRDLDEIGFVDALVRAITIVEWPERAGAELPPAYLDIAIADGTSADTRVVSVSAKGLAAERILHQIQPGSR